MKNLDKEGQSQKETWEEQGRTKLKPIVVEENSQEYQFRQDVPEVR